MSAPIDHTALGEWQALFYTSHPVTVHEGKCFHECRCPQCGRLHYLKFYWTGRGIPRKYCRFCRSGSEITANKAYDGEWSSIDAGFSASGEIWEEI